VLGWRWLEVFATQAGLQRGEDGVALGRVHRRRLVAAWRGDVAEGEEAGGGGPKGGEVFAEAGEELLKAGTHRLELVDLDEVRIAVERLRLVDEHGVL
jgi:hypothetical protein